MLGTYHLNALFEILNKLHFIYEPDKLWQFVLQEACKTLQAEASTFYEMREDSQELRVCACAGIDIGRLSNLPFKVGSGICGWVAQYQQPALVNDVRQDHRFSRQIDVATGFITKSILCIPVYSVRRTYGVFEVINRRSGQFSPQDQEFMTLLARQVAVAYQNLLLISEVQNKENLLHSLVESLSGGLIAIDKAGKILFVNAAAEHLLALNAKPFEGKAYEAVFQGYASVIEILKKTLESQATVSRQEFNLVVREETHRIGYTTILISDPKKQTLGAGMIFQQLPKN